MLEVAAAAVAVVQAELVAVAVAPSAQTAATEAANPVASTHAELGPGGIPTGGMLKFVTCPRAKGITIKNSDKFVRPKALTIGR
jgi:hypothetical protein